MGAYLVRIWERRRIQPSVIQSAWRKCIAKNKQSAFHTVLIKLCIRDSDMATILRTSAGHAASADEADFVMQQLASRIASFFEVLISDSVLNNIDEFNQTCFHLGQQHAGFSKEEFQLTWWDAFTDTLMEEFSSATLDEQKAWRALLELVNREMKLGYQKARGNMRNCPNS